MLSGWGASLGLGVVAFLARVCFAHAGLDADWPYSVHYKGDALVWLQWVLAGRTGGVFEAGLPLRPPGNAWLIDALWDGTPAGIGQLKLAWAAMGGFFVVAFHRSLLGALGAGVATVAAGLAALSTSGLILASSPGNEVPYLALVAAAIALRARPGSEGPDDTASDQLWRLVVAAGLHALATLFRAEHLLVFVVFTLLEARNALRDRGSPRGLRAVLLSGGIYVLALVPWHLSLWSSVARFNAGGVPLDPAGDRALASVEARTNHIAWLPDARDELDELPAFSRRAVAAFVSATVMHRRGGVVGSEELGIIEETWGTRPKPLAARPFVAPYGALNFFLANHPQAGAGFNRAALNAPPPLAGGVERYPPELVGAMPPGTLSFQYPPHLEAFNDGYRLGLDWILSAPGEWARLATVKLTGFWRGASLGWTGYGIPIGASGTRHAVDVVVPRGPLATFWRIIVLLVCIVAVFHLLSARQDREHSALSRFRFPVSLWLVFGLLRALVAVAFFGYARQGALAAPVVHIAFAVVLAHWVAPRLAGRARRVGMALLVLGLALEGLRAAIGVTATVDGVPIGERDPFPGPVHVDRQIEFTSGDQK